MKDEKKEEKKMPGMIKQASNLTKAVTKHVAGGLKYVSEEEYVSRLQICDSCEFRKANKCTSCGCPIKKKAKWKTEDCPENKWV